MVLSTRQMSVSCAEIKLRLSPPKARSPCLQRACNMPARCVIRTFAAEQVCGGCVLCVTRTSVAPGMHVGGTAVEVPAGIKFAFAGRPNRTGNARVCDVPTGDAAHAAVIAQCSVTAACSLRAPASLKTRTGDVRRRYGSLRFGYRIRRRPAAERCTAGCDWGFKEVVRHTGHNIIPWRDPKQWLMINISDFIQHHTRDLR